MLCIITNLESPRFSSGSLGFVVNVTLLHKTDHQTITLHDMGMKLSLNMPYIISTTLELQLFAKAL